MNPVEIFETSVIVTMGILVTLVKRRIGQSSFKPGKYYGRPLISTFLEICFNLVIETRQKI